MRKIIFTFFLLGSISFIACQKDEDQSKLPDNQEEIPTKNYYPLAIGNYWVYQNFLTKDNQTEIIEELDSVVIIGDTIVREEQYFVFESYVEPFGQPRIRLLRDSLGYIVNSTGTIFFTLDNPGEVFFSKVSYVQEDTATYYENYIDIEERNVDLPAGEFKAITRVSDYILLPHSDLHDTLKYRQFESYFIDGIGLATDHLFLVSGSRTYNKKLLRYSIQENP